MRSNIIAALELSLMWWLTVSLACCALLTGCGGWFFGYSVGADRRSPLERAAQEGNTSEVKRLLASGADPNEKAFFGIPLTFAAGRKGNIEVVRLLLAAGANPNGRPPEGNACWSPPLVGAAVSGDIENTRALLDAGAPIEQSKCSMLVVAYLTPPILGLLVERGLNLNAVDDQGRNGLHLAFVNGVIAPVPGVEYLIHAGVPLNARDHSGKTPLAYWREPRDYEKHWFATWLFERLGDHQDLQQQRENQAAISRILERAGAIL